MSHVPVGNSPFLKRVLVPFWVIRILIMVVEVAIYAFGIGIIASNKDKIDQRVFTGSLAVFAVMEGILVVCLLLDIVCIIKRARRTLSPKFFFATNLVQTTIFVVLFVLSILGGQTVLSLILNIAIVLSFIGLLVYASIIFHQDRKGTLRGSYTPAAQFAESTKLATSTHYDSSYTGAKSTEEKAFPTSAAYEPDRTRMYYDSPAHHSPDDVHQTNRQEAHEYV
ncbi:hypothetical protein M431DRAFT_10801 [Trichoderma harzianum CBS 226.95]|uniref:Uncharacterized protein n=1 Tax=Trichoderma harzianum CBS 226.95 TaxID=983964 RepID=A0A2T3ZUU2_TRIHA|nr:hypothetical protein M431DRAFT_10801 [Trichoderma harzianum CBS 226.95]PTB48592.1 hypothetical protein M431DRAFT_10801 [Trichoderma harzianum CBS 226.95]